MTASHEATRRRRVLVSAYSCGPGAGSEPGTGWQFAVAAAEHNDVWLVTRRRFAHEIDRLLSLDPRLARNLHVTYLELAPGLLRAKRGSLGVYWYYVLWQRRLRAVARQLHAAVGFDVAHHVTFASDWLPVGLTSLTEVPLVWGPVGGATYTPASLRRWLGSRGRVLELARRALTGVARAVWGDRVARHATIAIVHNDDVARRFGYRPTVVEPNPALTPAELEPTGEDDVAAHERQRGVVPPPALGPAPTSAQRAVFIGRLVSWKGTRLALATIAQSRSWTLDVVGDGPDRRHLARAAMRSPLRDRVTLHGPLPRAETLRILREADVLLLPSTHDSASWVTAEAVASGTPVVCLDVGGPPVVMAGYGVAVPAGPHVVDALAEALEEAVSLQTRCSLRWLSSRLPATVDAWYDAACRRSTGPAVPITSHDRRVDPLEGTHRPIHRVPTGIAFTRLLAQPGGGLPIHSGQRTA